MKNFFIVFLTSLYLVSCDKRDGDTIAPTATLPPPANNFKFSCTINGAYWGTDSTFNNYLFETAGDYRILICIGFDSLRNISASWIGQGINTMNIEMDTSFTPSPALILYSGFKNGIYLDEYFPISGNLHFTTFDSIAKTVSGTFESVQVEQNVNDTVIITNGVFTNLPFDVIVL